MPKHIIDKKGRDFTGDPARHIMRHHVSYITILLLILPLLILSHSCIEERPKVLENTVLSIEPIRLELSTTSLDIGTCENVSRVIKVRSTNMEWAFTDIPDWITVTPSSGSGDMDVTVEVSENTRAVNRVALVNFGSTSGNWNYSIGVTVSQYRAAYTMSLPVDSVMMEAGGGTKTIQVDTNTDTWTIIIPKSMDWCTALKTENGIALTATPNSDRESRTGIIELHTDDVSAFLTVTQRPAGIISTTDRVEFPLDGGIQTLSVNIDAPWTIETSYSWIDVKTKSGDGGFVTIPMEATPNFSSMARDGFIYIVLSDDHKIEIPVHQDCIEFSVDMDTILVASGGSTERLKVQSNLGWQFMTDSVPDWISVDPLSGNGSTTVLVKVKANIATTQRSAQLPIYVMSQNGNNILGRIAVEICQDGRLFGADSSAIHFSDKPGSTVFNIKSDGYWFVNSNNDWITVYPDEGEESGQVKVSVSENFGEDTRVGAVIVRTQGQRDTIPVYQAGKYIDVSSDMLYFRSRGDSVAVSVSANGHWSAEYDVSWIRLSETEGDGSCELMVTAQDNPSTTRREGVILLTRDGMNPVRITVRQYGRYLSISSYYTVFFSAGGTSEPYIVDTDGKYEIESESDWITINKETESQFTITVSENTASELRTGTIWVYLTDLTSGSLTGSIAVVQGGHFEAEYVDLGLSVYWATCNVGATTPEGYGNLYSWGVITPGNNSWSYYRWCRGSQKTLTKYNSYSDYGYDGFVDYKTILEPIDDAASINWGGDWRMPTRDEFDELINSCDWIWTEQGGVKGLLITSCIPGYTDRSIFLPAAGASWGNQGSEGYYWQSNVSQNPSSVWNVCIRTGYFGIGDESRCTGHSVRPVKPSPVADQVSVTLSRTAISIMEGTVDTIIATVKQNYNVIGHDVQWSSSNEDVAVVSPSGEVTGIAPGICVITATSGLTQAECCVNVTSASVTPDVVDLGLSVNWATFNIGADRPEGSGYYFAWGETEGKSSYSWLTYKYCEGAIYTTTSKYCNNSMWGTVDYKYDLELEDDAAAMLWGDDWRMPTLDEMDELIENCTWTWTTLNGVQGYNVTSNIPGYKDRSIFLPATGECCVDRQMGVGLFGQYWTSSSEDAGWVAAWKLRFHQGAASLLSNNRYYGYPIRPVCPSSNNISPVDTIEVSGYENDYGYVDLGLSVNWATLNVGAEFPEGYGDYFAWGETEPYYETGYAQENPQAHWKEGYTAGYGWSTYKYCKGSTNTLTKYCGNNSCGNNGFTDTLTILVPEDDVAHVKWGGNWRMPTQADFDELLNNCDCEWITQNGVNGWKVTSRKDLSRFIFLPAAGCRYDTSLYGAGERGLYWSSSLDTDYPCYAQRLYFDSGSHNTYGNNRDVGQSVRPVCPSSTYVPPVETVDSIALSRMDLNLTVGDTVTVFATSYSQGVAMTADIQWFSDDTDVATVDEYGMVVAVGTGNCIITASVGYVQSTCTVIVTASITGYENGYEYVDLGLSVKWATFNVGATKPEEYGDYFAWGETEPYYVAGYALEESQAHWKEGYTAGYGWSTYKYCKGSTNTLTKYCGKSSYGNNGFTDTLTILVPEDDVAHVKWGGNWRMPTQADFDELLNNCDWAWTTQNGVNGLKVTSRKDLSRFIFLPAAGYRYDTSLDYAGESGYYWSSSLYAVGPVYAQGLYFNSGGHYTGIGNRFVGQSVRPVYP